MNIAAIIIGIDGWEQYTLPLIESLQKHEPDCRIEVIDNGGDTFYSKGKGYDESRVPRMCYSAAINHGKWRVDDYFGAPDWYIVLSNDVICTAPFAHMLEQFEDTDLVGPQLWHEHGLDWIVGWCVCIPAKIWDAVGGWDENYIMSSWEDVDYSTSAREKGFWLAECADLPFVHLDQQQRFGLPGYAGSEDANRAYFMRKHGEHAY